jgi:hypothetical protein
VADDDEQLRRGDRPALVAHDARFVHDDRCLVTAHAAGHLGVAARAHHDDGARIADALHRGAKALGNRQHAEKDDDHARDADDRHRGRAEALGDRAQVDAGHRDDL